MPIQSINELWVDFWDIAKLKLRDIILLAERADNDADAESTVAAKIVEVEAYVVCAMISGFFKSLKIETPDFWRICINVNHKKRWYSHNQALALGTVEFYVDVDIAQYSLLVEEKKFQFLARLIISTAVEILKKREIETKEISNIYDKLDFEKRFCEYYDRGVISPNRGLKAFVRVEQQMSRALIYIVVKQRSKVIFERCIDETSPNPFAFSIYFGKLFWKSDAILAFERESEPQLEFNLECDKME